MANKSEDHKSTTDIVTSSNLIAQETTIVGDIITQGNIRIEGKVEGGLKSKNKIVIGDSAYVAGDIYATKLIIENGAIFNGKCNMTGDGNRLATADNNHGEQEREVVPR